MAKPKKIYKDMSKIVGSRQSLVRRGAVYLLLRSAAPSGSIHNYRRHLPKFCARFEMSDRLLRTYINDLVRMGWIRREGKHLVMVSMRKVRHTMNDKHTRLRKYVKKMYALDVRTYRELVCTLQFIPSYQDGQQQQFMINRRLKNLRIKFDDPQLLRGRSVDRVVMSRKRIASSCNYDSASTGCRMVKRGLKHGIVLSDHKDHEPIGRGTPAMVYAASYNGRGHVYHKDGMLYRVLPNKIIFSDSLFNSQTVGRREMRKSLSPSPL